MLGLAFWCSAEGGGTLNLAFWKVPGGGGLVVNGCSGRCGLGNGGRPCGLKAAEDARLPLWPLRLLTKSSGLMFFLVIQLKRLWLF
jgi:hypothetical protein